jgi:AcrR family transcriptional regulator
MSQRKRDAQATKGRILLAARRLFAQRDIPAVSIRDIAEAAGVSHGLVQQYFGTREQMIAAIIQNEIEEFDKRFSPVGRESAEATLDRVRDGLRTGRARFHDYAVLITRAQLAGVEPETMLDPATPTPALALANAIRELQTHPPTGRDRMDPLLVSAYVNAALFAFETMYPWLMTSVGLKPGDYEARLDEIADLSVKLIGMAIGASPKKPGRRGKGTE